MKRIRRIIQGGFLGLSLAGIFIVGGNAERWCPFGGVETVYTYFTEGNMLCSLGVSNLYIIAAVLVVTLLLRRAFCGYVCPIGTISAWLQIGADRCGIRPVRVPDGLDRALSTLKYVLLALVLIITCRTAELVLRGFGPCYALLSRHGEDITAWAYITAAALGVASLFVMIPFCRWLCPLAAVMHPFSRFGVARVRRDPDSCLSCGKCSAACPMNIRVDALSEVKVARCLSCMRCIDACPPRSGGALTWGPGGDARRPWPKAVLVSVLLATLTSAVIATYAWPLPSFVQRRPDGPRPTTESIELSINEPTCRGRGTLLWYFIDRDDEYAIDGPLRLEAWPGSPSARAGIFYRADCTDADSIRAAITMPYFDALGDVWRVSPFAIDGYDPFGVPSGD